MMGNVKDTKIVLVYSLVVYILFVLSTKTELHINLMIVLLLLSGYIYEINCSSKMENSLSNEENKKSRRNIFIGVVTITVLGTLIYNCKKEGQYGGGYNILNYLLY